MADYHHSKKSERPAGVSALDSLIATDAKVVDGASLMVAFLIFVRHGIELKAWRSNVTLPYMGKDGPITTIEEHDEAAKKDLELLINVTANIAAFGREKPSHPYAIKQKAKEFEKGLVTALLSKVDRWTFSRWFQARYKRAE
jgi:hypothetical protein